MILFLAKYPTSETIREGMSQRIMSIDKLYVSEKRIYLNVLLFKNLIKKKTELNKNALEYQCNAFLHLPTIIKLFLRADMLYIHSLYNVLPSIIYILLYKKKVIFDVHGVVPEENELLGKKLRCIVFNFVEKLIFRKKNLIVICVTNQMIRFYKKKYKCNNNRVKFVRYIIFPSNLRKFEIPELDNTEKVNIVYAGNLQKWQNIELMIKSIKSVYYNKNYLFYILTGDLVSMKYRIDKEFENLDRIILMSLPPNELASIYCISHYGFVLRDDNIVNNVACPTKLIEYMNYGIVPIVLSDDIGDFKEYDYERVCYKHIENLKPYKSKKNIQIIQDIKEYNAKIDIIKL